MTITLLSVSRLEPLLEFASSLDLNTPESACAALESKYPLQGVFVSQLRIDMVAALEAEKICTEGESPMSWSRIFRPSEASFDFSADAVDMSGAGPKHEHPNGEIDLCFKLEGEPDFDGNPEGWTVYGKGSIHTPTVSNGRMLILYLLPGGAIKFIRD